MASGTLVKYPEGQVCRSLEGRGIPLGCGP